MWYLSNIPTSQSSGAPADAVLGERPAGPRAAFSSLPISLISTQFFPQKLEGTH